MDPFNLIYYDHDDEQNDMFTWVTYDLSTHSYGSCNYDNISMAILRGYLEIYFQLEPQFNLYNSQIIYYVK